MIKRIFVLLNLFHILYQMEKTTVFSEYLKNIEKANNIKYFANFSESDFLAYNKGLATLNLTKGSKELCNVLNNLK